tara:strand:- start:65 stop:223 length:159 start_codon:yes stop_codon:yes gene_type:complete
MKCASRKHPWSDFKFNPSNKLFSSSFSGNLKQTHIKCFYEEGDGNLEKVPEN